MAMKDPSLSLFEKEYLQTNNLNVLLKLNFYL